MVNTYLKYWIVEEVVYCLKSAVELISEQWHLVLVDWKMLPEKRCLCISVTVIDVVSIFKRKVQRCQKMWRMHIFPNDRLLYNGIQPIQFNLLLLFWNYLKSSWIWNFKWYKKSNTNFSFLYHNFLCIYFIETHRS